MGLGEVKPGSQHKNPIMNLFSKFARFQTFPLFRVIGIFSHQDDLIFKNLITSTPHNLGATNLFLFMAPPRKKAP